MLSSNCHQFFKQKLTYRIFHTTVSPSFLAQFVQQPERYNVKQQKKFW